MAVESDEEAVFSAGQSVEAGVYLRLDSTVARRVELPEDGPLPPSFDGRVAVYRRVHEPRHRLPIPAAYGRDRPAEGRETASV